MQQNYRFLLQEGLKHKFEFSYSSIENIEKVGDYVKFKKMLSVHEKENFTVVSRVSIDGLLFTSDLVIIIDRFAEEPQFGEIKYLLLDKQSQDVIFVIQKMKNNGYSDLLAAYNVIFTGEWTKVSYKNLISKLIYDVFKLSNGKNYVLCEI